MAKIKPKKNKTASALDQTTAIVLAAGLGTRMNSSLPKVLHKIGGRPMINHVLQTLELAGIRKIIVVVSKDMQGVENAVSPYPTVIQPEQSGTGNAVKVALKKLNGTEKHILIVFAADPLVLPGTLKRLVTRRLKKDNPALVALGFKTENNKEYGRLVTNPAGKLEAIIEAKDASPKELAIKLCNSGSMAIDGSLIKPLVNAIKNKNSKKEYYLTDLVNIAKTFGHLCAYVEGNEKELIGVDTRADLATAEALFQSRARENAMLKGVTLLDPNSVYFSWDTKIGKDVIIEPNVFFGPGMIVEKSVTIRGFCYLEGSVISRGSTIGPFARLRPGTKIAPQTKVGNFVEIKNAVIGTNVNINHLSYIGDAVIGTGTNIGAGTITCNFDGVSKYQTNIGKNAFIGSNTSLIAPLIIGDGATIGAGSTINKNVSNGSMSITRPTQKEFKNWKRTRKK